MTPPRLIHLTTTDMSLDWLLRPQLEAFADAGYEVIGMSAPGPHVDALRASGIEHVSVPNLTRAMAPSQDLKALFELRRMFRELAPAIVHTHNPKPGLLGRLAARSVGVPAVVNTVHGLYALPEDPLAKRSIVYGLERIAASCSSAELLQNPEDLLVLRRIGVPDDKLTVLGNGVDLSRFDPLRTDGPSRREMRARIGVDDDDTVVIGAVGRLVWEKGYRTVFDAAERLQDENCVVVVVGPDEPEKAGAVDREARARAEASGVRFLGRRDDMVELYRAFDVYTLASHREGYPRSAMEASAMGLPVIATDIRGCRQVVADGVTGHLFPVDDTDALVRALRSMVRNPQRRARMGVAARDRALRSFDDRDVINTTLRTYEYLLGDRAPVRSMAA